MVTEYKATVQSQAINQGTERWNLGSHLHKLKPLPDPNGNRAERRAAKKKGKKSAK